MLLIETICFNSEAAQAMNDASTRYVCTFIIRSIR